MNSSHSVMDSCSVQSSSQWLGSGCGAASGSMRSGMICDAVMLMLQAVVSAARLTAKTPARWGNRCLSVLGESIRYLCWSTSEWRLMMTNCNNRQAIQIVLRGVVGDMGCLAGVGAVQPKFGYGVYKEGVFPTAGSVARVRSSFGILYKGPVFPRHPKSRLRAHRCSTRQATALGLKAGSWRRLSASLASS